MLILVRVLIYPKTASFTQPLPVFEFPKMDGLRLWVLPFCLKSRRLSVPDDAPFADDLPAGKPVEAADAELTVAAESSSIAANLAELGTWRPSS